MAAIDGRQSLLKAGFKELPVDSNTIELYRLSSLNQMCVEKAKLAILENLKTHNLTYQGVMQEFVQRVQKAPYLVVDRNTLKLVDDEQIGDIYKSRNQFAEAIAYYWKSQPTKTVVEQGAVKNKINDTYKKLDDTAKSLFTKLVNSLNDLSVKETEQSQGVIEATYKVAEFCYSIAKKERSFSHYQRAMECFDRVIKNAEQGNSSEKEKDCMIHACVRMKEIYTFCGEHTKAKEYEEKAKSIST